MLLIPMLISIKDNIPNVKSIKRISMIVFIITAILLMIIFGFLLNVDVDFKKLEMPAVYAVDKIIPKTKMVYGITILISIFTTAVSLGISFLRNTAKNNKIYNMLSLIICVSAVGFSKIGFSNLINIMYPILGTFGFLQIILLFLKPYSRI